MEAELSNTDPNYLCADDVIDLGMLTLVYNAMSYHNQAIIASQGVSLISCLTKNQC